MANVFNGCVTFLRTSAKGRFMAQTPTRPPKRPPSSPFGGKAPARPAKPIKLRWDTKPVRKARPDAAPSKGALERADGEERIAKLLARAGVASRREVERMIADGRVTLNGVAIETPTTLLKSLHGIAVDGKAVGQPAPTQLYMFHKPEGCLTAERDFSGRQTIYDVLPKDLPRLMPIGRLDLNTEGLLLLTNDGEFKRQMEMPSTGVERTYRARVFGDVSQTQLEELIHGIEIDGVRYGKIDANLERRTGRNGWLEMTLTEGKNREVRRVLEHFELEVSRLIRTRYGPFTLGDLAPGAVGEVRRVDLIEYRNTLK
jgi:23S rRNA pseudouridine2605 synthase